MIPGSLGWRSLDASVPRESGPEDSLVENIDVSEFHLQREALFHRGKGNDHAALMAELRHDALDSLKSAAEHTHRRSDRDVWMGP